MQIELKYVQQRGNGFFFRMAVPNRSDADEFVSYGGTRGVGQPRVFQGGAPDVIDEHVGE